MSEERKEGGSGRKEGHGGWRDGWRGEKRGRESERERGLRNRQRDDRRGGPVTGDERVREKASISSPLGDEKPEGGGGEGGRGG